MPGAAHLPGVAIKNVSRLFRRHLECQITHRPAENPYSISEWGWRVRGIVEVETLCLEHPEIKPLSGRADWQKQGGAQDEESCQKTLRFGGRGVAFGTGRAGFKSRCAIYYNSEQTVQLKEVQRPRLSERPARPGKRTIKCNLSWFVHLFPLLNTSATTSPPKLSKLLKH